MTHFTEAAEILLREAAAGAAVLPWTRLLEALQRATGAETCLLLTLRGTALVPVAVAGPSTGTPGRCPDPEVQQRLHAILAAPDTLRFEADGAWPEAVDAAEPGLSARPPRHEGVGIALRAGSQAAGTGVMTIQARAPASFDATAIAQLRAAAGIAGACLIVVDRLRQAGEGAEAALPPLAAATDEFQRRLVAAALDRSGGNWTRAARLLQIDRANLHRLARRLERATGAAAVRLQRTS